MKYFLYRMSPEGHSASEKDFVALEVAPHVEAVCTDLEQDIKSDLFIRQAVEPHRVSVDPPRPFANPHHPSAAYAMRAEISPLHAQNGQVLWYGIRQVD